MLGQNKNYPYVKYIMWTFCEERVRDFYENALKQ